MGKAVSLESNPWPSWLPPTTSSMTRATPRASQPRFPHLEGVWRGGGEGGWLWGFNAETNRKATCNLSYEASQVAQMIKNPPAMQETWDRSLGQEDALEEDMATHSSILAWRIPWTEEPGGLQSLGWQSWTQLSD